jgi:hypothetical protein
MSTSPKISRTSGYLQGGRRSFKTRKNTPALSERFNALGIFLIQFIYSRKVKRRMKQI